MPDWNFIGQRTRTSEGATNKYAMIIGAIVFLYGLYDKNYGSGTSDKLLLGLIIFFIGGFFPAGIVCHSKSSQF